MKKIIFNAFVLLVICSFTLAPINIHALIIDPVILEPSIVEELREAVKGRITPEAVDTLVTQIMQALALTTMRGMSREYSADTKIKLRMPVRDLGLHSNLRFVKDTLRLEGRTEVLEKLIIDFCEGFNDGSRYLQGQITDRQIIYYHFWRKKEWWHTDWMDAYDAGVNTAVRPTEREFPWMDPTLYEPR